MCDTDSMAIVTHNGARWRHPEIPALEPRVVEGIIARFDRLSPYDRDIIPHLVKTEFVGNFYGISAKRYCLETGGAVAKYSEHGLGHLRGPSRGWMRELWGHIIQPDKVPFSLAGLPALAQWTVSTPGLYHTLRVWNDGKAYADRIKPFNFLSVAYIRREHKPRLVRGVAGFQLIAPYLADQANAYDEVWTNKYDPGSQYLITGQFRILDDRIKVVTYADVLADYRIHPETKFSAWNGTNSGPHTVGRLRRLHVTLAGIDYIGKESNKLEESTQGQLGLTDTQLTVTTSDQRWDQVRLSVFRVLARYRDRENARLAGLTDREYRRIKSGETRPHNIARDKLIHMAVYIACEDLHRSPGLIKDPRTLFTEWTLSTVAS